MLDLPLHAKGSCMKNVKSDEMRAEYERKDLGKGVRGKYFEKYRKCVETQQGEDTVDMMTAGPTSSEAIERKGRIENLDRSFDIAYWQRQGPKAIFAAAHEMVIDAHRFKGIPFDDTIRRDIERFGRFPG